MEIYDLQRFWFSNVYNGSISPHTHRYTITFDPPVTVKGQIFLNVLSPAVDLDKNVVGLAAACVKKYTYLNSGAGIEETVDYTGQEPFGSINVTNITSVTWELIVTLAWAGAHGTIYYIK
ncbi:MAG: hypothetical protein WAN69_02155 [Candidatus Korobacteraceae bacterium]